MNIKLYLKHVVKLKDKNEEIENCNYEMCSNCGGYCCKSCGCEISPKDLDEVNVNTIKDLLNSGVVSIDAWENMDDSRTFFLRIRNKDSDIVDFPIGKRECILFNPSKGCRLEYTFRGKGAKELIPNIKNRKRNCESRYTKSMCKDEWKDYQDIIKEACKELDIELPEHLDDFNCILQIFEAIKAGKLF